MDRRLATILKSVRRSFFIHNQPQRRERLFYIVVWTRIAHRTILISHLCCIFLNILNLHQQFLLFWSRGRCLEWAFRESSIWYDILYAANRVKWYTENDKIYRLLRYIREKNKTLTHTFVHTLRISIKIYITDDVYCNRRKRVRKNHTHAYGV